MGTGLVSFRVGICGIVMRGWDILLSSEVRIIEHGFACVQHMCYSHELFAYPLSDLFKRGQCIHVIMLF